MWSLCLSLAQQLHRYELHPKLGGMSTTATMTVLHSILQRQHLEAKCMNFQQHQNCTSVSSIIDIFERVKMKPVLKVMKIAATVTEEGKHQSC